MRDTYRAWAPPKPKKKQSLSPNQTQRGTRASVHALPRDGGQGFVQARNKDLVIKKQSARPNRAVRAQATEPATTEALRSTRVPTRFGSRVVQRACIDEPCPLPVGPNRRDHGVGRHHVRLETATEGGAGTTHERVMERKGATANNKIFEDEKKESRCLAPRVLARATARCHVFAGSGAHCPIHVPSRAQWGPVRRHT